MIEYRFTHEQPGARGMSTAPSNYGYHGCMTPHRRQDQEFLDGRDPEVDRLSAAVRPGDVLALYVYSPDAGQRQLKAVRIDDR